MPLPRIVDELAIVTGDMASAMDMYKKFGTACSAVSKQDRSAFKVAVHI